MPVVFSHYDASRESVAFSTHAYKTHHTLMFLLWPLLLT